MINLSFPFSSGIGEDDGTHNVEPVDLHAGAHLLTHFQVFLFEPKEKFVNPYCRRKVGDDYTKVRSRRQGKQRGETRRFPLCTPSMTPSGSRLTTHCFCAPLLTSNMTGVSAEQLDGATARVQQGSGGDHGLPGAP